MKRLRRIRQKLADLAARAALWTWQKPAPEREPLVLWEWGYPDLDPCNTNLHGLASSEEDAIRDAETALAWIRARGLLTDGCARLVLLRRVFP